MPRYVMQPQNNEGGNLREKSVAPLWVKVR
jgi:hypothetical protein